MKRPSLADALCDPRAYPHQTSTIRRLETHMSWVFLTGNYAYKVKKPVRFDFVDFTDPDRRRFFCEEELRCNRRFAPELYLEVARIVARQDGSVRVIVGGDAMPAETPEETLDWAVRMVQFDPERQADRLLAQGALDRTALRDFGRELAAVHARLDPVRDPVDQIGCVLDNFRTLDRSEAARGHRDELARLERATRADIDARAGLLAERHAQGRVRECHGDLHLSNMVDTGAGLRAFDCLEFDEDLRRIDVISDAAFLFMDCATRGAQDLGYAFVDGYLDASGDYGGVAMLGFWARYRSLVRAKVAALRAAQLPEGEERTAAQHKLDAHVEWAARLATRPPPRLILTCGLSGSGKSFWAERLVAELGAIRLRSDVLRKTSHGLQPGDRSGSGVGAGLYTENQSLAVYRQLADLAVNLLAQRESVIVDAAHLRADQRAIVRERAQAAGVTPLVLYFQAPDAVLRQRIEARQARGADASEADTGVLDWQQRHLEPPSADEPSVAVDTQTATLDTLVARIVAWTGS